MENVTINIEKRFWARVDRRSENECWGWLGDAGGNGYGRISLGGKRILAHRLSYMLNIGHIDSGTVIHHECGDKYCVNPRHLKQVTPRENTIAYYNNGNGY